MRLLKAFFILREQPKAVSLQGEKHSPKKKMHKAHRV
jgi:hypothetical protein